MAKVLDALAKARQEREQRMQSPAGHSDASSAAPTSSAEITEASLPVSGTGPDWRGGRMRGSVATGPMTLLNLSDEIVSAFDVQSPITEQVRHIRTNLETVLADYQSRPIVVTSPVSGDGKTVVTANLAWVLADNPDQQVLLVDADMRKPDQHRLFGVRQTPGLSELLSGECSLDDAIHETGHPQLKIIPAGRTPEKPTELLGSDHLSDLLHRLQPRFSWILFDTPPMLPVTDASIIARESVGLIMVLRMGQTHFNQIERAQEQLAEMRLPVLGCILNALVGKTRDEAYYHRYYAKKNGKGSSRR